MIRLKNQETINIKTKTVGILTLELPPGVESNQYRQSTFWTEMRINFET